MPCGANTFLQVHRSAALFVHDAKFDGMAGQAKDILDAGEGLISKGHFFRPVHLGFHHIDRPQNRVPQPIGLFQIVHGDQRGHQRIHQTLGHFRSVRQQDRGVGHQMSDIAHPQQGAALDRQHPAVRGRINPVRVQAAAQGAPALVNLGCKVAPHQAQPVGIGPHLVLGIHAGDRILAIHDRRDRAFHLHIGQQSLIPTSDEMRAIKDQFHMQAVVLQKDRIGGLGIALVAHEFPRAHQRQIIHQKCAILHVIAPHIGMAGPRNRKGLIQKHPRPRHHPRAAPTLIAPRRRGAAHGIGAIEAIIKAAPARIGGIQRIAGVGHRYDQLRAGHAGNLGVDIRGVDLEIRPLGQEVADILQKGAIGAVVMRGRTVRAVPRIDPRLQILSFGQKCAVLRGQIGQHRGKSGPKRIRLHASARQRLCLDKLCKAAIHLQAVPIGAGHAARPFCP